MKGLRKALSVVFIALFACLFVFAAGRYETPDDIIVLYTNDVHCGIDDHVGYAGLAAYKAQMERLTPYVTLVDCGDAIQGDLVGTVSNGEYIIDMMNFVGYDYAIPGNHEFDYAMPQLRKLMDMSNFKFLACNINYTGEGESLIPMQNYQLVDYGDRRVAFIGVATPESITKSTPAYFQDKDGNFIYDFTQGENGKKLYARVQRNIDACRAQGADYVLILAHLGDEDGSAPYRSIDLIENTTGVDAVLDAHSHSVIPGKIVKDKAGHDVILTSTGTKLEYIGKVLIAADGTITTSLETTEARDPKTQAYVEGIKAKYEEAVNKVVGQTKVDLAISNEDGIRLIRNRETNLGDLCGDAYRAMTKADIALVNGGGIRATIAKGDITLANIIKVHPWGNMLCMVRVPGQTVLDALEMASRNTMDHVGSDGRAAGECGGFLQVSGLKYTIDTKVPSSVVIDENQMFVKVDGPRRVKDVQVLENGKYVPIDPAKLYTVASHNYMLKDFGDGMSMFKGAELVLDRTMIDNQVLITYIVDHLGGVVGDEYLEPQGRITVI